jgi:hypothetical protein
VIQRSRSIPFSYRDRLHIDWDDLLRKHQDELIAAKTPTEFAQAAGKLLSQAKDKHIWCEVGIETIPSLVRPMTPNANYALLPKLVPQLQKHGQAVVSGRWDVTSVIWRSRAGIRND